jgi:hypothetical protein
MRLWNGHGGAYNGSWDIPAEPRRPADCLQRPLRSRFRQRLTPSVSCLKKEAS